MKMLAMVVLFLPITILTLPLGINLMKDGMCLYSGKFTCPKKGHLIEKEGNFCSRCGQY